ncbi:hypothetical protein GYA27_04525 [candidate division WWE3 bacterium]|uniref:Uncharacterized protein n=1 Tax=candidate division WWE3 bacterium TaxID=2053526 RepID=A0A7X9HH05_UNCKA|nr:hypothetical protein [candidate division WWE3 bacterium]
MLPQTSFGKSPKPWCDWRTVEIGGLDTTPRAMLAAIVGAGMRVTGNAQVLLDKVRFAKNRKTLNLVLVTGPLLGVSTYEKVFEAAKMQGLSLCPAEVGPVLRQRYKDQPHSEWDVIAMKPISDFYGTPYLFTLSHKDYRPSLDTWFRYPGSKWSSKNNFIFVLSD